MDLAKRWRRKPAYYRLEGERNRSTGAVRFPARLPLPTTTAHDWEPYVLSGKGEIYSFAVLRNAATGFEMQTPYPVALVRLDDGPLVEAQLTDCSEEELAIGMRVEMVTRRMKDTGADGLLVYAYKFRPVVE
ncbi:MAG: Zn-ribbon domain-containing OB-fold protein [Chloroflexaceae bacterium]|nr:Zn-ribbon domain-containing OB-fold protein [Chloroflexaceae bacterium]